MRRINTAVAASFAKVLVLASLTFVSVAIGSSAKASDKTSDKTSETIKLTDPVAVLNLQAGDYSSVPTKQKVTPEDVICADGAVSTVAWSKDKANPVLMIGERLVFSDFNNGLKLDTQPYYQDHCTYHHSTQTLTHKLIHDLFVTCENSASTEHTEIHVQGSTLDYTFQRTVSKKHGLSTATTTSCKLERKP